MSDPQINKTDRRSFLKWSLLGSTAAVASMAGCASALLSKENVIVSLACGPVVYTDASRGGHCRLTATEDFTLTDPHNAADGQRLIWEITQDAVGSRKMTLDKKFAFGTDLTAAVLSTAPHKKDFLTAIYNAPLDKWHVVAFIRGY